MQMTSEWKNKTQMKSLTSIILACLIIIYNQGCQPENVLDLSAEKMILNDSFLFNWHIVGNTDTISQLSLEVPLKPDSTLEVINTLTFTSVEPICLACQIKVGPYPVGRAVESKGEEMLKIDVDLTFGIRDAPEKVEKTIPMRKLAFQSPFQQQDSSGEWRFGYSDPWLTEQDTGIDYFELSYSYLAILGVETEPKVIRITANSETYLRTARYIIESGLKKWGYEPGNIGYPRSPASSLTE